VTISMASNSREDAFDQEEAGRIGWQRAQLNTRLSCTLRESFQVTHTTIS